MSPQRGVSEVRKTRDKETTELRRARGEISCAECRRLKLKCDKTIPCSSCVRRGCPAICPNGTQSAGQTTRYSLADVEKLHRKLSEARRRIRLLEDALQIAHASTSPGQHPLLSEDLLGIKSDTDSPAGVTDGTDKELEKDELDKNILGSFGKLAVSDHEEEASLTGAESCSLIRIGNKSHCEPPASNERNISIDETDPPSSLPAHIARLSGSYPFASPPLTKDEIQDAIEEMLPSYERASALVEAYLENLSWFFRPVEREQIMEELIPVVYKGRRAASGAKSAPSPDSDAFSNASSPSPTANEDTVVARADAHTLALLMMIFSAGAIADLTLPPCNDEAELYYHLSRAALGLKSVFERTTLVTVQAVVLVGTYDLFSCRKSSLEGTYKLLGFGLSLASSLGLHRDPSRWKLSSKMMQRRRYLFWELYSLDMWKGFGAGRPTTFSPPYVDCEMPQDTDIIIDETGLEIPSIWCWRHRFVKEVVTEVIQKLDSVRGLKYSEMLALDQKIRNFGPRELFKRCTTAMNHSNVYDGVMPYLRRYMMNLSVDNTLMLLHRNFFARAILEDPVNPMRSIFAPSFLSAYRSATTMLRVVREEYDNISHFMLRIWPVWAHTLTASVIVGSVAALGSSFALAPQAFIEFDLSIALFAKAQMHPVVKSGLPILLRLREKAYRAITVRGNEIIPNPIHRPFNDFLVPGPFESGEPSKEFDGVSGMGRLMRKSFGGEFAYRPSDLLNMTADASTPPRSVALSPSSSAAVSPLPSSSTDMSVFTSPSNPKASSYAFSPESRAPPRTQGGNLDKGVRASADAFGDRSAAGQSSGRASGAAMLDEGMEMETPVPSNANSAFEPAQASGDSPENGQGHVSHHAQGPNFPASVGFGVDSDMSFSPFDNAAGGMSDAHPLSMSQFSLYDAGAFAGTNFTGTSGSASGSAVQSDSAHADLYNQMDMSVDPFSTLEGLSAFSPTAVLNTDFDVSYDMRSAVGQESLLSMLPQEMEAWRTLLEDPRLLARAAGEEI
ncbi:hypothetical protein M0805_001503 [Coniferiporia weirii]|nr:hypothetical protein M0805_001503 [Coniferiporia weirii]